MEMPRAVSSLSLSVSTPVRARTKVVLPWSMCPAVPTIMRCDLAVARQSPLHRALPDSADQAKAHRSQYGQLRVWAIGAASFPAFAATVQSDRPQIGRASCRERVCQYV